MQFFPINIQSKFTKNVYIQGSFNLSKVIGALSPLSQIAGKFFSWRVKQQSFSPNCQLLISDQFMCLCVLCIDTVVIHTCNTERLTSLRMNRTVPYTTLKDTDSTKVQFNNSQRHRKDYAIGTYCLPSNHYLCPKPEKNTNKITLLKWHIKKKLCRNVILKLVYHTIYVFHAKYYWQVIFIDWLKLEIACNFLSIFSQQ